MARGFLPTYTTYSGSKGYVPSYRPFTGGTSAGGGGGGGSAGGGLAGLAQSYTQKYEEATAANLKRYNQALAIHDEIISRYQPGGAFEKSTLQQLGEEKTRYIGKGTQDLISSGLFGTTVKAGLPGRFEKEVGAPTRLKLEDIQMQRLSGAQLDKAGLIERREDAYPDIGLMTQLMEQIAQGSGQRYETPMTTIGRVVL